MSQPTSSVFVVFLRFAANKSAAGQLMDAHKAWLKRGFDEGWVLLAGSLEPGLGGAILAHNTSRTGLEAWVNEDPFVAGKVVTAEIHEVDPARAEPRLQFLVP